MLPSFRMCIDKSWRVGWKRWVEGGIFRYEAERQTVQFFRQVCSFFLLASVAFVRIFSVRWVHWGSENTSFDPGERGQTGCFNFPGKAILRRILSENSKYLRGAYLKMSGKSEPSLNNFGYNQWMKVMGAAVYLFILFSFENSYLRVSYFLFLFTRISSLDDRMPLVDPNHWPTKNHKKKEKERRRRSRETLLWNWSYVNSEILNS